MDGSAAAFEGVNIAVVSSVTDQLVVTNTTNDVFEVLDDDGAPFLRIGPDGVSANLNSPGWYQTNNPFGASDIPDRARAGAAPEWAKVAVEPSWGWFDHRLHPAGMVPPPEIVEAGRPAEFAQWAVPVRWRGVDATLSGTIEYRPVRGSIEAELTQPPVAEGLLLGVLQGGVPGLFLDNGTGETVVVMGAQGEPFLRFNSQGVQANRHSPSWLAARRAEGGDLAGELIDATLPPAWRSVSEVPRFGWVEPRTAYPEEEPPEEIIDGRVRTTLVEWTIPLQVGAREITAEGITAWVPLAGAPDEEGSSWARYTRPAAVAAAVLALAWLLLRHRPKIG